MALREAKQILNNSDASDCIKIDAYRLQSLDRLRLLVPVVTCVFLIRIHFDRDVQPFSVNVRPNINQKEHIRLVHRTAQSKDHDVVGAAHIEANMVEVGARDSNPVENTELSQGHKRDHLFILRVHDCLV